jgi:hypothetical protein
MWSPGLRVELGRGIPVSSHSLCNHANGSVNGQISSPQSWSHGKYSPTDCRSYGLGSRAPGVKSWIKNWQTGGCCRFPAEATLICARWRGCASRGVTKPAASRICRSSSESLAAPPTTRFACIGFFVSTEIGLISEPSTISSSSFRHHRHEVAHILRPLYRQHTAHSCGLYCSASYICFLPPLPTE